VPGGVTPAIQTKSRDGVATVASAFPPDPGWSNEVNNPLRSIAFRLGLVVIFLRFSLFQATLTSVAHFNFYLLYVFGLPTLMGVVLCGGVQRTFQGRLAWYWTGYAMWMIVAMPFSIWRGSSANLVWDFLRADFPILLIIAGLGMTWRECRAVLHTIALAAVVSAASGPLFQKDFGAGRAGLEFGTVADPNDYAAHLILVLPFLLWEASNAKSKLIRLMALASVGLGLIMILKSASRGGAVALAAAALFFLVRASANQRLAFVVLVPVAAAGFLATVPQSALDRIMSMTESDSRISLETEASASTRSREYLFKKSIEYTLQYPLFGVGPGEFAEYEGQNNRIVGTHGLWHATHNTFTQVSSECGIPALIFFLAGIVSTFRLLNSVHREARHRTDCNDIRSAAFWAMLGLFGFCVAITFLDFAYFFYLPAMAGLAILLSRGAGDEMRKRAGSAPGEPAVLTAWGPKPGFRRTAAVGPG
jgi:O-antigen ligase